MSLQKLSVITSLPDIFNSWENFGVVGRAIKNKKVNIEYFNPRTHTSDNHKTIDDTPYGGGCGMVMKYQPIVGSIKEAKSKAEGKKAITIFLSPHGKHINQGIVNDITKYEHIILLCGRYEGVDNRVVENHIDLELSIGDFVMSGGEIPAMAFMDAIIRLQDDVLNNPNSHATDSFQSDLLLQHPIYTKPEVVDGFCVPKVLLSGNHKKIEEWKKEQSLIITKEKRPDLLKK
jgi:tRNA (guanine37-N1)-methyltransferase